jgi:GT2 family glycosyltransferase
MIMHPDVELVPGCMRALSQFLGSNPRAGIVSPDLYYPNGAPNRIRLRMPTIRSELRRVMNMFSFILLHRKLLTDELFWDHASETDSQTVMSVCMLVRREVIQAIGDIDPGLVFYYANDFLCHQARRLKWTCHYTPAARAIHFERYAPTEMYSDNSEMEYKRSTTAANPRMRSDYFAFLSLCYPRQARFIMHGLAFVEDAVQLLAQFKRPFSRKREITQLWASIALDLGL